MQLIDQTLYSAENPMSLLGVETLHDFPRIAIRCLDNAHACVHAVAANIFKIRFH